MIVEINRQMEGGRIHAANLSCIFVVEKAGRIYTFENNSQTSAATER